MERIFSIVIKDIAGKLSQKGLKLAVAESCTGGLICDSITDLPGASKYFVLGLVSYSPEAKEKALGVSPSALKKHGVISADTASAMAVGALKACDADVAISTTGVAGPDTVEGKEVGTVFVAAARRGKVVTKSLKLEGGRKEIKRGAALEALNLLGRMLDEWA